MDTIKRYIPLIQPKSDRLLGPVNLGEFIKLRKLQNQQKKGRLFKKTLSLSQQLGGVKKVQKMEMSIKKTITKLLKLYARKKSSPLDESIEQKINIQNQILGGADQVLEFCKVLEISFPEDNFVSTEHYQKLYQALLAQKNPQPTENIEDIKSQLDNYTIIKRIFNLHLDNLITSLKDLEKYLSEKTFLRENIILGGNRKFVKIQRFYKEHVSAQVEKIFPKLEIKEIMEFSELSGKPLTKELTDLIVITTEKESFTELYNYYLAHKREPEPVRINLLSNFFTEELYALLLLKKEHLQIMQSANSDQGALGECQERINQHIENMGGTKLVDYLTKVFEQQSSSQSEVSKQYAYLCNTIHQPELSIAMSKKLVE